MFRATQKSNIEITYLKEVLGIKGIFLSASLIQEVKKSLAFATQTATIQLLVPANRTHQESQLLDKIKQAIKAKVKKSTSVEVQKISGQIKSLQVSTVIPTYLIIFGEDLLSSDLKSKDWNRGIFKTDLQSCTWMWTYALSEMQALSPEQQSKCTQLKQTVWNDIKSVLSTCLLD